MVARDGLGTEVGRLVRTARVTIGWTQQELGARAHVPQSLISRLERGVHSGVDFDDLERIAKALGGRFRVELRAPFLDDRARQRDRVHARCVGYVVRRLRLAGWVVASEVEIVGAAGPGWIDVLAWNPDSGAVLVIEVKTEIHDFGRIQRTLAWYERNAWATGRRLGWAPRRVVGALILLDTAVVADALRANRALATAAFPARARDLTTWIGDSTKGLDRTLAVIDPLSRRRSWIRTTALDGRRSKPAYLDYSEIARRLSR